MLLEVQFAYFQMNIDDTLDFIYSAQPSKCSRYSFFQRNLRGCTRITHSCPYAWNPNFVCKIHILRSHFFTELIFYLIRNLYLDLLCKKTISVIYFAFWWTKTYAIKEEEKVTSSWVFWTIVKKKKLYKISYVGFARVFCHAPFKISHSINNP